MIKRIENDKDFLKSCKLMDYSMLIFIFKRRTSLNKRKLTFYNRSDKKFIEISQMESEEYKNEGGFL